MRTEAGLTLIEVLVATLLIGVALVPLMHLYPGLLEADLEAEMNMRVGTVAASKMEEIINRLRADIGAVASGAQSCSDFPSCRVEWTIATEASSATQGVGSLVTITVTACVDENANTICEAGETPVQYDAKLTSRP